MDRFALVGFGLSLALGLVGATAKAHDEDGRNRVVFQVEAVREVQNDWATARLTVSSEGKDASVVAADVNRIMASAVARSKDSEVIEVTTGSYVTHPVHDDGRIVRWRAFQELRLETGDVDELAELVGELQGRGVALSGIDFSVAKETRRALEDELIEEALGAFQARAARVAGAMGRKSWSLIALSVGQDGQPPPFPVRREARMMALGSQPVTLEGGTSEIRVVVDGTIELE